MAALDFGMALARGMLPKAEKAQKDLINLAGGRNVFKSEDWWNKTVDEQISSGYRKVKEQGREYLMPSGEYQLGRRNVSTSYRRPSSMGQPSGPLYQMAQPSSPLQAMMMGYTTNTTISYEAPTGALVANYDKDKNPRYTSRAVDVYEGRTYFTGGELSDIEAGAKAGSSRAKRQTEQAKSAQRRLRKGTGGLLAKAATPEDTGLPSLGKGGLGLTTSILGSETKL